MKQIKKQGGVKKRQKIKIAYQNKDITAKSFGESLKGKSFEVYGLSLPGIVDVKPTNLPAIEANELRLDNLFLLADESIAIVDYESEYKEENKSKYLLYLSRTAKRLFQEYGKYMPLRMIVIYTADIRRGSTDPMIQMGDLRLTITEVFLTDIDSEKIFNELEEKIRNNESFNEEDIMKLVIYPLTLCGREAQQKAVSDAIDIAEKIEDDEARRIAASGIFTFSDKIISDEDAKRIIRRLTMNKIEKYYEDRQERAVKEAEDKAKKEAKKEKQEIAVNFLRSGVSVEKVVACTGFTEKQVRTMAAQINS